MWKDSTPESESWFIWKFAINGTIAKPSTSPSLAKSINTLEIVTYESQFDEDFNKDGFIGSVTVIEKIGNGTVIYLSEKDEYRIKESDNQAIKIFDSGNTVTNLSNWQPIAVEVIPGATKEGNEPYYKLIMRSSLGAYSLWLVNSNGAKLSDTLITSIDLRLYEQDFQQDLNNDSSIHKVNNVVEANGLVELLSDEFGYIINFGKEKIYL